MSDDAMLLLLRRKLRNFATFCAFEKFWTTAERGRYEQ
jgi:hypothetical protein